MNTLTVVLIMCVGAISYCEKQVVIEDFGPASYQNALKCENKSGSLNVRAGLSKTPKYFCGVSEKATKK